MVNCPVYALATGQLDMRLGIHPWLFAIQLAQLCPYLRTVANGSAAEVNEFSLARSRAAESKNRAC